LRRHRRNDNGSKVPIHLVRRDHHTRAALADFAANGWIEIDLVHLESRNT